MNWVSGPEVRTKPGRVEITLSTLRLVLGKFRTSMEETDGVPESVKFGLHNSPRLLADSAEEASKELFKQVQWYLLKISQ